MPRLFGRLVTCSLSLCFTSLFAPACSDPDASIFVRSVVAPPIPQAGGVCKYSPDPTGAMLSTGTLDVALTNTYELAALVGNQMTSSAAADQPRTETSRIKLEGAIVRVVDPTGGELDTYTSLATGFLDPVQGTTPSYGSVFVTALSPKVIASQKNGFKNRSETRTILSKFKVFGHTLGGQYVETGEYQFPIELCNGCLVSFPAASEDPAQPRPNCAASAASASGGTEVVAPCRPGQDQAIDCRLCQGNAACNPATP